MTVRERERLVNRILAGYFRLNKLKILPPSFILQYEATLVYDRVYKRCQKNGLMDEVSILNFLYDNLLWDDNTEERFHKIPKEIEDNKLELYKSRTNSSKVGTIRRKLDELREEYSILFGKKHSYDEFTCEGIASFSQIVFLVRNCTFFNRKLYSFDRMSLGQVLNNYRKFGISESQFRELGRTEPWGSYWNAIKNGLNLLPKPNEEQLRLIRYSIFYDNLYQSSDCPPSWVIDDDDMLDGYLIEKHAARKKEEDSNDIDRILGKKISNCSEVYIVCDDNDENALFGSKDYMKVNDMNNALARSIRASRNKAIEEHGSVLEHELPDMKRQLKMQLAGGK